MRERRKPSTRRATRKPKQRRSYIEPTTAHDETDEPAIIGPGNEQQAHEQEVGRSP